VVLASEELPIGPPFYPTVKATLLVAPANRASFETIVQRVIPWQSPPPRLTAASTVRGSRKAGVSRGVAKMSLIAMQQPQGFNAQCNVERSRRLPFISSTRRPADLSGNQRLIVAPVRNSDQLENTTPVESSIGEVPELFRSNCCKSNGGNR
jgi:hypothetical protein